MLNLVYTDKTFPFFTHSFSLALLCFKRLIKYSLKIKIKSLRINKTFSEYIIQLMRELVPTMLEILLLFVYV